MRRLWFLLGMGVGALLVWSWLHDDRKIAQIKRQRDEGLTDARKQMQMDLVIEGIEQGIDFTDDAWWEQELAKHEDADMNWSDDDVDGEPIR